MFSFVVDISFLHLIRKIAYLNFCTNELSWGIKKGLVDSYARVIVNLSCYAVMKALVQPIHRLRNTDMILSCKKSVYWCLAST